MTSITDDRHVAALTALVEAGIEPDVQELLVSGDPSRGVAPGALAKAVAASVPTASHRRLLSELTECLNGVLGAEMSDRERVDDAIRLVDAIRSSYDSGALAPEGWQLVPKVATEAMRLAAHDGPLLAGEHVMTESNREWLGDMYATMLESAPACAHFSTRREVPVDGRTVKRYVESLPIEWSKQAGGYDTSAPHPYYSATVYRTPRGDGWSYRINGRSGRDDLGSRDEAMTEAQDSIRERLRERLQEAAHLVSTMFEG